MCKILCLVLCIASALLSVFAIVYCHACVYTPDVALTVSEPIEISEPVEISKLKETEAPVPETVATEPPATEPVAETEPLYTEEELEALALVIYQEAGGDACSDETRMMVGTVVMNRVADDRFPNTIYEVVTAKQQYGNLHWTGLVWPSRSSHQSETHAVERAYLMAERVLLGERNLPSDVVWQAGFTQGTEVVAYQDGMYFCR